MSDLDLDLLREWSPAPSPSDELRADARARLEAQYAPTAPRRTGRAFGRRVLIAAVAATVLVAIAVFAVQRVVDDRIGEVKTVGVPKAALGGGEIGTDPVNILVVGSDSRENLGTDAFGTPAETGPAKSDTMFVLRVDGESVQALWIPRDLMVGTTGQLFNSKFNDGPQGLIDAVRIELGITVDHYVEIDFRGFEQAVDAIGGVTVQSPGRARDPYSGLDLAGPGCVRLDGERALQWVRSRHLEIYDGTVWKDASPRADLDRIARQQEFLRSFALRAKAKVGDDPTAAVDLVDAIVPALTVDSQLTKGEILSLVRTVFEMDPNSLQAMTIPIKPSADGAHVELDQPAATQAVDAFLAGRRGSAGNGSDPTTTVPPPPVPTLPPPACREG